MEWADITEEYASGLLDTDTLLTVSAVENATAPTDATPSEIGSATERDGEIASVH